MTPRRTLLTFAAPLLLLGLGCNKPSEESCKTALHNIQKLLGTASLTSAENLGGAVRRCRGASKREAVQCAIDATSMEQLEKCSFYADMMAAEAKAAAAAGSGSGSAAPPVTK